MAARPPDSLDRLTQADLIGVVRELIGEVGRMDKATDRSVSGGGDKNPEGKKSSSRRGSQLDKLTIGATVVVGAKVPPGSRHKGYEEIVVQDLCLRKHR